VPKVTLLCHFFGGKAQVSLVQKHRRIHKIEQETTMNDYVPPLYSDRYERGRLDDLATFFSIIKATEYLERAFINNAVKESEVGLNHLLAL
jgi:hypothetical protein